MKFYEALLCSNLVKNVLGTFAKFARAKILILVFDTRFAGLNAKLMYQRFAKVYKCRLWKTY